MLIQLSLAWSFMLPLKAQVRRGSSQAIKMASPQINSHEPRDGGVDNRRQTVAILILPCRAIGVQLGEMPAVLVKRDVHFALNVSHMSPAAARELQRQP